MHQSTLCRRSLVALSMAVAMFAVLHASAPTAKAQTNVNDILDLADDLFGSGFGTGGNTGGGGGGGTTGGGAPNPTTGGTPNPTTGGGGFGNIGGGTTGGGGNGGSGMDGDANGGPTFSDTPMLGDNQDLTMPSERVGAAISSFSEAQDAWVARLGTAGVSPGGTIQNQNPDLVPEQFERNTIEAVLAGQQDPLEFFAFQFFESATNRFVRNLQLVFTFDNPFEDLFNPDEDGNGNGNGGGGDGNGGDGNLTIKQVDTTAGDAVDVPANDADEPTTDADATDEPLTVTPIEMLEAQTRVEELDALTGEAMDFWLAVPEEEPSGAEEGRSQKLERLRQYLTDPSVAGDHAGKWEVLEHLSTISNKMSPDDPRYSELVELIVDGVLNQ